MISNLLRSTLTAVCLAALPLAALADAQAEAAQRLNALLSSAQTMTGGFSQMTLSANGANLQETTGTLALKRPGKFRWHTDPPLEQVLVRSEERRVGKGGRRRGARG